MTVERFKPTDPRPGAARLNELVDPITKLQQPGGGTSVQETHIALFELTEGLTVPDLSTYTSGDGDVPFTDNAKEVLFLKDDDEYGDTASSPSETLYLPNAFLDDNDVAIGHASLRAGQRCYAWFNPQSGRWEILTPPLDLWRFELKTALTPGSTATAYLLDSAGAEDTNIEFLVSDPRGIYRGRKIDEFGSPHNKGSQGYAKYFSDSNQWEIQSMQMHALMISGQATAAFDSEDPTFTIDGVQVDGPVGAIITDSDPAGSITIQNVHNWDGDNNAEVDAKWSEADENWRAVQVACLS